MRHLKLWFIPHEANNHHPHVLRPHVLKFFSGLLIIAKVTTTIVLFVAYPSPGQFAALTTQKMVELTNASRVSQGLPALSIHPRLVLAAEKKAKDMLTNNYFAHTSPSGARFFSWIQQAGYNYSLAGENLAMDFTSAEGAHNALMASPSHKENIMNSKYVHVGMAVVSGEINGENTIVLVEMFGTPYIPPEPPKEVATTPPASTPPASTPPPATTPPAANPPPASTPEAPTEQPSTPEPVILASVSEQNANSIEIQQNESAELSVTFKNSGTTTWPKETKLTYNSEYKNSSYFTGFEPKTIGSEVKPGESTTITFDVKAPTYPGEYDLGYVLSDQDKIIGGSNAVFRIIVTQKPPVFLGYNTVISQETATPAQLALASVPFKEEIVKPIEYQNTGFVSSVIHNSDRFFFGFLLFMIFALVINILVRIKVQHAHVIIPTLMVIVLTAAVLFSRFSYLQNMGEYLKIL